MSNRKLINQLLELEDIDLDVISKAAYALEAHEWQPIETAPKDQGYHENHRYIMPKHIQLLFPKGKVSVAYWELYDAYDDDGWIEPVSNEQLSLHYGDPTHWKHIQPPGDE